MLNGNKSYNIYIKLYVGKFKENNFILDTSLDI